MSKSIVIIGAGPAGMMAAIAAGMRGESAILIERMGEPGMKLLATGGGRCNLTNTATIDEIADAFGRHGRFMLPALHKLPPEGLREFFRQTGVETKVENDFFVFPESGNARSIRGALCELCEKYNVETRPGVAATGLLLEDGAVRGVVTGAENILADAVIIAAGGCGYPVLGSDGSGFTLAEQAGHTVSTPSPSLVPLTTSTGWIAELAGIAVNCGVSIDLPKHKKSVHSGDLLFTHRGLSGPVILNLSGTVAELLGKHGELDLLLNLTPSVTQNDWEAMFKKWHSSCGTKALKKQLQEFIPARLVGKIISLSGAKEDLVICELSRESRLAVIEMLTRFRFTINGTEGFNKAMATRGGVRLKEVNPETLESRLVMNLYFAGEVLDLDGPCGGYNLQWAFASGRLAGESAGA
ncbi:MAG: NAD(P)/FAD-dependent oxidoreductase [Planctomycetes bacterium]|nr:NAD(P)/FAD-dependent oxidoreductase [Planctomycetota bacterium]